MADKKITELTALETPTDDDLLTIVDDVGGLPTNKKISWANIKTSLQTSLDSRYLKLTGGEISGDLTVSQQIGCGGDSPDITNNSFQAKQVFTNTSGTLSAIFGYITANPSAASSANYVGVQAYTYGNWGNSYNINLLAGYYAYAGYYGTATCAYVVGMFCGMQAGNSGTVNLGCGVFITSASKSGTAVITNNYGLYVESQTAGNNNYAIYTNSGIIRFGDTLKIASGKYIEGEGTGINGLILKNLKNTANTNVSGTPKTVVIDIGGTPYYFLVYPTSAA